MDDRVSKHFKFSEFTKSDTANRYHINNTITEWDVRDNIVALVENVLEPLREAGEAHCLSTVVTDARS